MQTNEIPNNITNRKLAINLYHVVQETIKNVAPHRKANNITVRLTKPNDNLLLEIENDGVDVFTKRQKSKKEAEALYYAASVGTVRWRI